MKKIFPISIKINYHIYDKKKSFLLKHLFILEKKVWGKNPK
jgi:hypothetical protein